MRGTQSNPAQIGMWNPESAANVKKVLSINRKPIDYTKDQMVQLYLMLYPLIMSDFAHRDDIFSWAKKQLEEHTAKVDSLNEQFDKHKKEYDQHKHIGNMGSPTAPPLMPMSAIKFEPWKTQPEDKEFKFGENQITESSTFSNNITHRKPTVDSANIDRTLTKPIAESYTEQIKLTPFDIGGNSIQEEDEFANTGA